MILPLSQSNYHTPLNLEKLVIFTRSVSAVLVLNWGCTPVPTRQSPPGIQFLSHTQYFEVIQSHHHLLQQGWGQHYKIQLYCIWILKYHTQLLTASPGHFLHLFCSGKQALQTSGWVASAAPNGQWFIKSSCRCSNAHQVANKQDLWNKTGKEKNKNQWSFLGIVLKSLSTHQSKHTLFFFFFKNSLTCALNVKQT